MLRVVWVLALTIPLAACDDPPAAAPSPPVVEPAPTPAPEETPPPEEPETIVAPSYSEAELDAMDPAALEAACFQGSTAACDRLGH
jgi:hypothetical protein